MKLRKLVVSTSLIVLGLFGSNALASTGNPAESAGFEFDAYADCVIGTGATGVDAVTALIERCGYDPGMTAEEYVKQFLPLVTQEPKTLVETMEASRDRFTSYEFSFFERLDQIAATAKNWDERLSLTADLEAEAIANLDSESANGHQILSGLSIARHSAVVLRSITTAPSARFAPAGLPGGGGYLTIEQQLKIQNMIYLIVYRHYWGSIGNAIAGLLLGVDYYLSRPV